MQIHLNDVGEHLVKVTLAGRLDTQGVERVEAKFTAATVAASKNVVVDLSQVEFVASMGIRMLIAAARGLKMRGARIVLFGVTPAVGDVFEAITLDKIIPVYASEADAIAAVGAPV